MSDNGSCYVAHAYADALADLGLRHLRIRPDRPRTNGKAERFIQTLLNEWAYARSTAAQTSEPPRSRLPQALQLSPTTRHPRPPSTGLEAEQPRWELQLEQRFEHHHPRLLKSLIRRFEPALLLTGRCNEQR